MDICKRCAGLCCRYLALPIETPGSKKEFDDIRWYLAHEGISVFVEEKTWYLSVANRCRFLSRENRCAIYEQRPRICGGYKNASCDYSTGEYNYELHFTSVEQYEDWLREKKTGFRLKGPWRRPEKKKRKKG